MNNPFSKEIPFSSKLFIGRKRQIWGTLERLANPQNRGSSAIYGETGIGKSWFLERIRQPDLLAEWEIAEPKAILISLDCREVAPWTPKNFWHAIFQKISMKPIPPSEQEIIKKLLDSSPTDSLLIGQLIDRIADNGRFLILILDNFEEVINHVDPEDPSFLNQMRSFLVREKKGLGIVLATTQALNDLLTDDRFDFVVSPFDNVFFSVELKPFDEQEANDFIEARLKDTDIRFTEEQKRNIFQSSEGHPDRLREACYLLVEAIN